MSAVLALLNFSRCMEHKEKDLFETSPAEESNAGTAFNLEDEMMRNCVRVLTVDHRCGVTNFNGHFSTPGNGCEEVSDVLTAF